MGTSKTLSTRVSIVKRSGGGKAVPASAYRAGERLTEKEHEKTVEKDGEKVLEKVPDQTWDYSDRLGVEETFILAPEHAGDWVRDRETLWNRVERSETRSNAQLARDFRAGLPTELGRGARSQIVREIVGEAFVRRGMVADVAVHLYSQSWKTGARGTGAKVAEWRSAGYEFMNERDSVATAESGVHRPHVMMTFNKNGGVRDYRLYQPHFHCMMTMRPLTADGLGFGMKTDVRKDWNDRKAFDGLRAWIAEKMTAAVAVLGELVVTVEHRSYEGRRLEAAEKAAAARADGRMEDAAKLDKLERQYAAKALPFLGAASKVATPNTRMADRLAAWVEAKHGKRVAQQREAGPPSPARERATSRVAGAVRVRQVEKRVERPRGSGLER